jgi:hypothetical protein
MNLRRHHLVVVIIVVALGLLAGAGCSSTSGSKAHGPTKSATTRTITERDKGTTVTIHVGDHLKLDLSNTYWQIQPASDAAVLRSDGPPVITRGLQGCAPGTGCGTESETFTAGKAGTATVSASRATCGEAMRCTGRNGEYKVTVKVT